MKRRIFNVTLVAVGLVMGAVLQPARLLTSLSAGQQDCRTFTETGKQICGRFLQYWLQNGGLPQQGYPVSNEFAEISELNGQVYTVQYFERAVFELHSENKAPYDVLLAQLGTFQFKRKYPNGEPGAPAPTPVPPAPPGLGTKVTLREGVTITLVERCTMAGTTGLKGNSMDWVFLVDNSSSAPFTVTLSKETVVQLDSTGKTYRSVGYYGAFVNALSVGRGEQTWATASVKTPDLPASATYLDLQIGNFSGQPLVFRYSLR